MIIKGATVWRVEASFLGHKLPGRVHYCAAVIAATIEDAAAEVRQSLAAQHQDVQVHTVTRPISHRYAVHVVPVLRPAP